MAFQSRVSNYDIFLQREAGAKTLFISCLAEPPAKAAAVRMAAPERPRRGRECPEHGRRRAAPGGAPLPAAPVAWRRGRRRAWNVLIRHFPALLGRKRKAVAMASRGQVSSARMRGGERRGTRCVPVRRHLGRVFRGCRGEWGLRGVRGSPRVNWSARAGPAPFEAAAAVVAGPLLAAAAGPTLPTPSGLRPA